ncbi:MAG: type 1 glutamine amidotransferase [Pseudomonadota bacterium]
MEIGILECGHAAPAAAKVHGDFRDMFAALLDGYGLNFQAFDVENMHFPDDVRLCDGWLLTGSKHGVYEDHAFIPPLEVFIRDAFAARVPMVGICFGHQIIAQALGGRVEKFRAGWAIGRQIYDFEELGEIALNAWHQDQVMEYPAPARAVAASDFCKNAALIYDDWAFTIQAHPEFTSALVADYVEMRRGTADYPDDRMDAAAGHAAAGKPIDRTPIAGRIADFFKNSHAKREAAHA